MSIVQGGEDPPFDRRATERPCAVGLTAFADAARQRGDQRSKAAFGGFPLNAISAESRWTRFVRYVSRLRAKATARQANAGEATLRVACIVTSSLLQRPAMRRASF
jgi:hypothetical protein